MIQLYCKSRSDNIKEAAGEANLTVVAIILIAVVVAVATPLVSSLMSTATYRSCCTDSGGVWEGGECKVPAGNKDVDAMMTIKSAYETCQRNNDVSEIKTITSGQGY